MSPNSAMERKRKLESSEETERSQRLKTEEEVEIKKEVNLARRDEEVENMELEAKREEEVQDDGEENGEDDVGGENQTVGDFTDPAISGSENQEDGDGNDDEPIVDLLEPFSKEQLLNLLKEAAENHLDVANRIREVADEDPVHRKIFIHGLGWDTKTETLIEVFKQYGEIEECKAVFDKASGKSKGYGFIVFKSRSGSRNALKQPQKKIGTRMAACQLASKGPVIGGNYAAAGSSVVPTQHLNSEITQRKIYVTNVGSELDPQKLLAFFSRFGEIEDGPLGLDMLTGKPKGFCLFVYKSVESAKRALEEPHQTFEGHVLHCQKAIDGPKMGKQQQQQHKSRTQSRPQNNPRYPRNKNNGYGPPGGHGHNMAGNQAGMGSQTLNPAIGQALTALLASQGAGLAFNPAIGQALLGSLGTGVTQGAGAGMPNGYGTPTMAPATYPGYVTQPGLQGGYQTQQPGQDGTGGGQYDVGQYGAGQYNPYIGQ